MEGKICMYNKFGCCKFKDKRTKDKRFAAEKECRFGIDCPNKHKKSEKC